VSDKRPVQNGRAFFVTGEPIHYDNAKLQKTWLKKLVFIGGVVVLVGTVAILLFK
jgi:hypothetical protein